MVRWFLLFGTALTVAGCGVIFPYEPSGGCPRTHDGVCATVRDVYRATNNADHVDGAATGSGGGEDGAAAAHPAPVAGGASAGGVGGDGEVVGDGGGVVTRHVLPVAMGGDGTLPLRSPPEVMRIWIAPWEDQNGDLVMSGYVFTELHERRWTVCSQPVAQWGGLRPVDSGLPARTPGPQEKTAPTPAVPAPQPGVRTQDAAMPRAVAVSASGQAAAGPTGGFWRTSPEGNKVQ